jgi:hypothetical protein
MNESDWEFFRSRLRSGTWKNSQQELEIFYNLSANPVVRVTQKKIRKGMKAGLVNEVIPNAVDQLENWIEIFKVGSLVITVSLSLSLSLSLLFVTLIILSFKRFIVLNMLCIIQESC